ncbi:MAG: EAL domain-containing protein [Actinomycetota bacterium]
MAAGDCDLTTVSIAAIAGEAPIGDPTRCDPLTGLGDRRRFEELVAGSNVTERVPDLTLVLVDLDRFRQVNDTLGSGAGDELLVFAAERIRQCAGAHELLRIGGDEFAVLCLDGVGTRPDELAERLVEVLSRPFLVAGQQVDVGAHIGIAAGEVADDLLRHAELALGDAKQGTVGTVRTFDMAMEERAQARRGLEVRLRRALALRQLSLHYQPQVRPDGSLVGFEALLRWRNDVDGEVPPTVFIPVAEEIGEIHAIGAWVIRHACVEAAGWPGHLRVAVNVSPIQFERSGLARIVDDALAASGLDPSRLEIEITENAILDHAEETGRTLAQLQERGVGIALDDFGTGYSSLSQLADFPFTTIKIDQSFVQAPPSERTRSLVDAILYLGRRLGMETIAEGVETEQQAQDLIEAGCDELQGYLFARPMPAEDVSAFIVEQTRQQRAGHGGDR